MLSTCHFSPAASSARTLYLEAVSLHGEAPPPDYLEDDEDAEFPADQESFCLEEDYQQEFDSDCAAPDPVASSSSPALKKAPTAAYPTRQTASSTRSVLSSPGEKVKRSTKKRVSPTTRSKNYEPATKKNTSPSCPSSPAEVISSQQAAVLPKHRTMATVAEDQSDLPTSKYFFGTGIMNHGSNTHHIAPLLRLSSFF